LGGVLTRAYEALLKQQRFSEPTKKYPYVFADLKPTTDNNYRMRSGLLPAEQKFVCLLNITDNGGIGERTFAFSTRACDSWDVKVGKALLRAAPESAIDCLGEIFLNVLKVCSNVFCFVFCLQILAAKYFYNHTKHF